MNEIATTNGAIAALESLVKSGDEFRTSATIRDVDNEDYDLIIEINYAWLVGCVRRTGDITDPQKATMPGTPNELRPFLHQRFKGIGRIEQDHDKTKKWYTLPEMMMQLAQGMQNAKFLIDSVRVDGHTCKKTSPEELLAAATEAWCEAFGVSVPTTADLEAAKVAHEAFLKEQREYAMGLFRSGEKGIAEWNEKSEYFQQRPDLTKLDLSKLNLKSIEFESINLNGSDFSGSDLSESNFFLARVEKVNFNDCTIIDANLGCMDAAGASFDNAHIEDSFCKSMSLKGSSLMNTKFIDCVVFGADIKGTDLSHVHLEKSTFPNSVFDEKTVLPANFPSMDKLTWKGRGVDPRSIKALNEDSPGNLTFEQLVERLQLMEPKRCKNAFEMLKQQSFELFSDIDSNSIAGVIKSQTNDDLVYSCILTHEGKFSCCTQNLKVCGGLRGAICKHIVLLIVGLARAGKFDPNVADAWMRASLAQKPVLDKNTASQTLLKYKGAVAGEIDWRPTETTPEDFYAF